MRSINEKIDYLVTQEQKRECHCTFTVSVWADKWLKAFKEPNLRASSLDKYKRIIKHLKHYFGDMPIASLDVVECQTVLNSIDKPSVKDDCYTLLNEMLIKAVKCRYIDFNPLDAVEIKKHKKQHGKAFTRDEQGRFVKACENNLRGLAFIICLNCGLRRGEVLALTYNDIDLEKREITINKQFQEGSIVTPKTNAGIRTVPINDVLYEKLKDIDFSIGDERLFPIKEHAIREHFQNVLKDCGLYGQGFTLHSLRHTFVTRCAEIGVARHITQKWAGHSTSDMTENVYTHTNSDFEKLESQKLNKEVNDTYSQGKRDH